MYVYVSRSKVSPLEGSHRVDRLATVFLLAFISHTPIRIAWQSLLFHYHTIMFVCVLFLSARAKLPTSSSLILSSMLSTEPHSYSSFLFLSAIPLCHSSLPFLVVFLFVITLCDSLDNGEIQLKDLQTWMMAKVQKR